MNMRLVLVIPGVNLTLSLGSEHRNDIFYPVPYSLMSAYIFLAWQSQWVKDKQCSPELIFYPLLLSVVGV